MIKKLLTIGLAGYLAAACAHNQDRYVGFVDLGVKGFKSHDPFTEYDRKNGEDTENVFGIPVQMHIEGKKYSGNTGTEEDYCFLYADVVNDGVFVEGEDLLLREDGKSFPQYGSGEEFFLCKEYRTKK